MNNKKLFIILCLILVAATLVSTGIVFFVFQNDSKEPNTDNAETSSKIDVELDSTPGETFPDFENGNEIYIDEMVFARLEHMQNRTPATDENGNYTLYLDGTIVYDDKEDEVNGILVMMIKLINNFAREEYSLEAHHQVQRFYLELRSELDTYSFDELCEKIALCIPKAGANEENLHETVKTVFDIDCGGSLDFVFKPIGVTDIAVEFYNVLPLEVTLTEEAQSLCIFNCWHSEENEEYERNLEAWLCSIIDVMQKNSKNDKEIIAAQLLYAGTLADTEYKADWADRLVKCFAIENMNYEAFKTTVVNEFGVSIDFNLPLQKYFIALEKGESI